MHRLNKRCVLSCTDTACPISPCLQLIKWLTALADFTINRCIVHQIFHDLVNVLSSSSNYIITYSLLTLYTGRNGQRLSQWKIPSVYLWSILHFFVLVNKSVPGERLLAVSQSLAIAFAHWDSWYFLGWSQPQQDGLCIITKFR